MVALTLDAMLGVIIFIIVVMLILFCIIFPIVFIGFWLRNRIIKKKVLQELKGGGFNAVQEKRRNYPNYSTGNTGVNPTSPRDSGKYPTYADFLGIDNIKGNGLPVNDDYRKVKLH